jgi:hypothetical protein
MIDNKMVFSKIFVALKSCIDGFLYGCRPYLEINSTYLMGKWKGQLAAAVAIDGHNWLFPVCIWKFWFGNYKKLDMLYDLVEDGNRNSTRVDYLFGCM